MEKSNIYKNGFSIFISNWNIYQPLLEKVKFGLNEKVLDAGCGNGSLGKYLKIKNLYGADLSKNAIKEVPKKAYKKLTVSPLETLPFSDKFFDSAISIQVIQYPKNPEKVFEELLRVAKNRIILTSANFNWFRLKSKIFPSFKKTYLQLIEAERFISKETFEDWAKKYDLKLEIFYLSNKGGWFRNPFGNWLSSEVVGVFYLK